MRVFIQYRDGLPTNVNTYAALRGFELLGFTPEPFVAADVEEVVRRLSLAEGDLVCGYVGAMHRVFEALGIPKPHLCSTPEEVHPLLGRRIWRSTLGEVRADERPVFIKPAVDDKAFAGHVRNRDGSDAFLTATFEDDFPILCSEVIDFISEWRCFVLDGEPIGARPYKGDFRAPQPSFDILDECLRLLSVQPAGFAVDLGVTSAGTTVLVEVNDGYSLGSYGLPPVLYAQLLQARWHELTASGRETAT